MSMGAVYDRNPAGPKTKYLGATPPLDLHRTIGSLIPPANISRGLREVSLEVWDRWSPVEYAADVSRTPLLSRSPVTLHQRPGSRARPGTGPAREEGGRQEGESARVFLPAPAPAPLTPTMLESAANDLDASMEQSVELSVELSVESRAETT